MNSGSNPSASTHKTTASKKRLDSIVSAAIHPSIGVARLGNSPEEYFLAPEVVDPPPQPPGFYRDGKGALKRQAVRFRIYGLNARGQVVAELTQSLRSPGRSISRTRKLPGISSRLRWISRR